MQVTRFQTRRRARRVAFCVVIVLSLCVAAPHRSQAQDAERAAAIEAAKKAAAAAAAAGAKPPGQPGTPGQPPGKTDEKKPDEGKDKKEEPSKTVKRPTEPPTPANPEELKVTPDENGLVSFNFQGQPWPAVLDWLAGISGMTLDWQEAPDGFVNLTTPRPYTVAQTRNLINRLLLSREFTLLERDGILSLVNVKKLDPSLVPRVAPEELDERPPYDFVKVSFPLERLLAESAVEEFKPMLSPNGRLVAMKETNRLEAIDAVANLREIHALLESEQSDDVRHHPPQVFKLRFQRAGDVLPSLEKLLGVEPKAPAGPMTPEQMQQAAMMAQQRAQQQKGDKGGAKPDEKPQVYLVADSRNNSIIAYAMPDKLAIIKQAIRVMDVPLERDVSSEAIVGRMQVYYLSTLSPAPLVKTLREIGNLDVQTRLEADEVNRAIIADATLADHETIRALVEKLDGTGRNFHVIALWRRRADEVAGTIMSMFRGGRKEKKEEPQAGFWDWRQRSQPSKDEESDKFQCDADIERNQLLLWADDIEMREVQKLLVALGELPPEDGNPNTVRMIDAFGPDETDELLDRIKELWPQRGDNPLEIDAPPEPKTTPEPPSDDETSPAADATPPKTAGPRGARIYLVQNGDPSTEPSSGDAQTAKPPIRITRQADGRLKITSEDTEALDRLEQLILEVAPPQVGYKIFTLNRADPVTVALNLTDFFKEGDPTVKYWNPWYDLPPAQKTAEAARLSRRPPLRFIADTETKSICVQGATPRQLRIIAELVEFYDSPEPVDSDTARVTQTIPVRYSKARTICDALKDVYRDLLSEKDRAFADKREQQGPREVYNYIRGSSQDTESKLEKSPKFKGMLSIGVDEHSNTLIVSAPSFLFVSVAEMIRRLDEAARPVETVRVIKLGPGVNAAQVQEAISGTSNVAGERKPGVNKPKADAETPKPGRPEMQSEK